MAMRDLIWEWFLVDERRQCAHSCNERSQFGGKSVAASWNFHEGKTVQRVPAIYLTCVSLISIVREEPSLRSLHFLVKLAKILMTEEFGWLHSRDCDLSSDLRWIRANRSAQSIIEKFDSLSLSPSVCVCVCVSLSLFFTRGALKNDWPPVHLLYSFP